MLWSEELKRDIPLGWQVKKLGEVATVRAGGDKPKFFSLEETETCCVPIYSNGITNNGLYGYTNEATVKDPSVTISARGTIGFSVLRNKPFLPIIRLIVITPHVLGSVKYFDNYIKTIVFENSGSVQQQLTIPQISNINILNPQVDILKKFEAVTSPIVSKIEIINEENQNLAKLRDWLLPMLMNGQLKVML
jgi:type I restriction enzyme S subunit